MHKRLQSVLLLVEMGGAGGGREYVPAFARVCTESLEGHTNEG